ncbi:hypothetical protein LTR53_009960 [Teratosphaeriaceae sp. CCFEE 6253]|nr:hypothetical protein LTR53_009960 [Teratosphaeriaceae sp. CCFEE 6253]
MTFTTLAIVYVLGGLTFLPLLIAAVLIPAWLLLPRTESGPPGGNRDEASTGASQKEKDDAAERLEKDSFSAGEGSAAAEATFAVLREYHFPSALAALNARATGGDGVANGAAGLNGSADGAAGEAGGRGGPSVYQSMYRTVFDRGKTSADTTTAVLAKDGNGISREDEPAAKPGRRAVVSASVFYIVLRHGHLMLYDSPTHTEVRHVISLAHHTISITDDEQDVLPEGDLFIRRTAIVLTPIPDALPNGIQPGNQVGSPAVRPKPFYLFSSLCIEKEDFYHTLLNTRVSPPISRPVTPEDLIKLQSTLHSTSLTAETRALNAIIGRIFLAFHRTSFLEHEIRSRIEKKIARVQKPTFIASLDVESIDLGNSAPVLSQPRLKDINVSGDMTLAFDLRYAGGVRVGIAAVAKIDLGARFKPRSVDLVLSTSIQRFAGKMLVRIKPSPSNRIWFCFESAPDMEIKVEPVVSSRQITYAFILRAIEERIRAVVAETLVKPNWDDVPFFDTRSQRVRGGMWIDEGAPEKIAVEEPGLAVLAERSEKSASMPALTAAIEAAEPAGGFSGSDTAATTAKEAPAPLKRRSIASPPLKHSSTMPRPDMAPPPASTKPLRSPSFTSPPPSAPIVAVDGVSRVPVRSDDTALQPKNWRTRAPKPNAVKKEAVQAVREMRDRSKPASNASERTEGPTGRDAQDPESSHTPTGPRSLFDESSHGPGSRTDTIRSDASAASSDSSPQAQTQRKNLLAATAAATNAARTWGWNALAARTGRAGEGKQPAFRAGGSAPSSQTSSFAPDQPMGRGQPLPPPGTPLPGPQKGKFGGIGGVVGGKGGMKRKPVLPPRRAGTLGPNGGLGSGAGSASETSLGTGGRRSSEVSMRGDTTAETPEQHGDVDEVEDDFGPWRENSGKEGLYEGRGWGASDTDELATPEQLDSSTAPSFTGKTQDDAEGEDRTPDVTLADEPGPPPLPARPRRPAAQVPPDTGTFAGDHGGTGPKTTIPRPAALADDDGIRIRGYDEDPVDAEDTADSLPASDEATALHGKNEWEPGREAKHGAEASHASRATVEEEHGADKD